jgi:hypothetical protein
MNINSLNESTFIIEKLKTDGYVFWEDRKLALSTIQNLNLSVNEDVLRPLTELEAGKNTLSSRYGLSSFPFHSDGVTIMTPPEYLLLSFSGESSSEVQFNIVDMYPLIESAFFQSTYGDCIFSVQNGPKSFLTPLCSFHKDKPLRFRYNPAVVKPTSQKSAHALELINAYISSTPNKKTFYPPSGSAILINNFRMLHSRGCVPIKAKDQRTVHRSWIRSIQEV